MREEIVRCDECGTAINGGVKSTISISRMVVKVNGAVRGIVSDDMIAPDFCGVPCLIRWVNSKLTWKNGDFEKYRENVTYGKVSSVQEDMEDARR